MNAMDRRKANKVPPAPSKESFRSVYVKFSAPMGVEGCSNATGPIVGIEIMAGTHADGSPDLVYWSDDATHENLTAYGVLADLCKEHALDLAQVTDMIAREFVASAGVKS